MESKESIAAIDKMRAEIRVGRVVRLRSGAPAMTVSEILDDRLDGRGPVARCHWVDERGGGREYTFPVSTLTPN